MATSQDIEAQLVTFINNDVIDYVETTSVTGVRYYESSDSAPLDVYQVTSVSENLKLYLVFENGALISRKGFSNLKDTTGIAEGGTLEGHFETFYANYGDVTQSVVSEFETFFATNLAVVSDLRVTNSIAGSTDGLEVFDITLSTGKHVWLIFDDETDELVGYYRLDRISDLNAQNDFSQVADIFNIWYSSDDVTTEVQELWVALGLTVTGNAAQSFWDEENQTDTITINVDSVFEGTTERVSTPLEIVVVFDNAGVVKSSAGLEVLNYGGIGASAVSGLESDMNTWYAIVTSSANSAPTLISSTPADDATMDSDANIVLTFSEDVKAGTGDIIIKKDDGTPVKTIDVTNTAVVTFNGTTVTINPTVDFVDGKGYYFEIASGVITDTATTPIAFAGISGQDLNFTTTASGTTPTTETGSYIYVRFIDAPENDSDSADQTELDTHNGVEVGTYSRDTSDGITAFTANFENALGDSGLAGTSITANPDGSGNLLLGSASNTVAAAGDSSAKVYVNVGATSSEFVYIALIPSSITNGIVDGKFFYIEYDSTRGASHPENGGETGTYQLNTATGQMSIVGHFDESKDGLTPDDSGIVNQQMESSGLTLMPQDHTIWLSPNVEGMDGSVFTEVNMDDSPVQGIYGGGDAVQTNFVVLFNTPDASASVLSATGTVADQVYTTNTPVIDTTVFNPADYFTNGGEDLDYYIQWLEGGDIDPWDFFADTAQYGASLELTNGAESVTLIAVDRNGVTAEHTFNVTVTDGGTPVDTTAPTLVSSTPADDATMDSDANIVLTFSEDVQAGTGDIIIKKDDGTPVKTIDVTATSVVTFNGTTVTINPTVDFVDGINYYVEIASGVITDTATTPIDFAGISGQDLNFTTNVYVTLDLGPKLVSSTPADDATMDSDANIVLTFDGNVQAGTGDIIIRKDDGTAVETIDVTSSSVVFNGTTVTIDPTTDFVDGINYYVEIASGVITDKGAVGEQQIYPVFDFAGISGQDLNFTTNTTTQPSNEAPIVKLTIPAQIYSVGDYVTIIPDDYFSDPQSDNLTYTVKFNGDPNTEVDWTSFSTSAFDDSYLAYTSATITAKDTSNNQVELTFDLTVNAFVFDANVDYIQGAVFDYMERIGLTDIVNLKASEDFNESSNTETISLTIDSYKVFGASYSNLSLELVFIDDTLDSVIEVEALPSGFVLDHTSIQEWWDFSDSDNNDQYALEAVENLLTQSYIYNWDNLRASVLPTATGENISIDAAWIEVDGVKHFVDNASVLLSFVDGVYSSSGSTIPAAFTNILTDNYIQVWYDYNGPHKMREADQQDEGYYDDVTDYTQTYSNVWTYTDHDGVLWTVVDSQVGDAWTSTQTNIYNDTRVHTSAWDSSTNTSTWNEHFTNSDKTLDYNTLETYKQDGSSTVNYTGTTDHIGWNPLAGISTVIVTETRDAYGVTTAFSGTIGGLTVSFSNGEMLIDGKSSFKAEEFSESAFTWNWIDEWDGTYWEVTEGTDSNGNWVMSEIAYTQDNNGGKGDLTGDSRIGWSSWDDNTGTSTWTQQEINLSRGTDFTRVETFDNNNNTSTETITGLNDHISWYYLGAIFDINVTIERDSNWNISNNSSGTVREVTGYDGNTDPIYGSSLAVTFSGGDILLGGVSLQAIEDDRQDDFFEDGQENEWTWVDWEGITWTVTDKQEGDTWSSTEVGSNGDVRIWKNSWDNSTFTSTMSEQFTSGDGTIDYLMTEIWREDGTSEQNFTGKSDQIAWYYLDKVYENIDVTIKSEWGSTWITAESKIDGQVVGIDSQGNILIGGTIVDFSGRDDIDFNNNENWDSSWEWMEADGTIWVVTDSQEGETWSTTEIAYTEDLSGNRTATGAERGSSSTWNERTQTNIWTDSEKSADGGVDFKRVETQRADGSSTETITGKIDKFGTYDDVDVTIERDSNWNITKITGDADGNTVSWDGTNITVGGASVANYQAEGGHANETSTENSWTWVDWEGITWTVTDKQEGDTWSSTEVGSNGDIYVNKNTWSNGTETWSQSFKNNDGTIDFTRVEVRANDGTSMETITGKDNTFGWWNFNESYTELDVQIQRDANWDISNVSGTGIPAGETIAVTFGFNSTDSTLTIDGNVYSGFGERANLMQETWVNTWEWTDGEGTTWEVTDKQEGDSWSSTEKGSNGDVRINTSFWDDNVDDYVSVSSFKSGSNDLDYSISETWSPDGSSTETIKGTTDQIGWIYLGEMYSDINVTITRDMNWSIISATGTGTNASDVEANFTWNTTNYELYFNDSAISYATGASAIGDADEQTWSESWEWTDWEGVTWTVTDSQQGDTWSSTEVGSNGATHTSESKWDSIKQISIWTESFESASGDIDFKKVEVYNSNGTSSETITGSADNISWYPLFEIYTDLSVTVDRDANWNIYSVSGKGIPAGETEPVDFGWSSDGQLTVGGSNVEDSQQHWVDVDQYWENTETWTDPQGVVWTVTEVQDGENWTRTEIADNGDERIQSNSWDQASGTSTWSETEVSTDRGIDVTKVETGSWDSDSQTNTFTTTVNGVTDHVDWMPLGDLYDVTLVMTFDEFHNMTDISGTATIASGGTAMDVTFVDGDILIDGQAMTMSWTDWDGTVWNVTQEMTGDTSVRTETSVKGVRVDTNTWNDGNQTNTHTEKFTKIDPNGVNANEVIFDVTTVETFDTYGQSTQVVTGLTNYIDWMDLGDYYVVDVIITRDENWNILSVEGEYAGPSGAVELSFSGSDNQLKIDGELAEVSFDDIGQSSENTWSWTDGEGITWTVTDKQEGDTWSSTEVGSNNDKRVMESTWDQAAGTNTWKESFTSNDGTINFVKTEVYDENTQLSTMTTTGSSDHIGWTYLGEIFTKINVTETRDSGWNTTDISGTAINADGESVDVSWDGEMLIDGDALTIHGPEDFSMSADNYENSWSYVDHQGVEWTVTDSQQGDAWVSVEESEHGDKRVNKSYWNEDTSESKYVTKFKSADEDIKYKIVEIYRDDGTSVTKLSGKSDHFGWDYVGEIYSDIDIKIVRDANWEIIKVVAKDTDSEGNDQMATAVNASGNSVNVTKGDYGQDILIDGISIYQMGGDFYQDFSAEDFAFMDQMDTGSWEYEYQDFEGRTIVVTESAKDTDVITIAVGDSEIIMTFDVSLSGEMISITGPIEGVTGLDKSALENWYMHTVMAAMDQYQTDAEELALVQDKTLEYLQSSTNLTGVVSGDINFDISDINITTESVKDDPTAQVSIRTRSEMLGTETERYEVYANLADSQSGNVLSWEEDERSFVQSEVGFQMIEHSTTSTGEDLVVIIVTNADGTTSMQATGTFYLGIDQTLITDVSVTSTMNGQEFVDLLGTGTAADGRPVIIKSDGTSPFGEPLINLTYKNTDGTFETVLAYDTDDMQMAQMQEFGNPLDYLRIVDGDSYITSNKGWVWDQTNYTPDQTPDQTGTAIFSGVRVREGKTDQTITVNETLVYNQEYMLTGIVHTISSERGDSDESYTATYSVNNNFNVIVEYVGTKQYRGELYGDVDVTKEILSSGQWMLEGSATKLDGTSVHFFKSFDEQKMEIESIGRDGSIHKLREEDDDVSFVAVNELFQWTFVDHEGTDWSVIEKNNGTTSVRTETSTAGDVRTVEETWLSEGGFTFTMTENFVGEPEFTETRTSTPGNIGGDYSETVTVVRKEDGVVKENYTEISIFDPSNYTSTMTISGTVEFMGNLYTDANIVVERDSEQNASSVTTGEASINGGSNNVVITMDGTHPWGEPKLVFTVDGGTAIVDTRDVIDNMATDNADPDPVNDVVTISENQATIIDALANDGTLDGLNRVDSDGNVLSLKSVGDATHGSVKIREGQLIYTPDYNYSGSDSFNYTVIDGQGGSAQGNVTITITGVNSAPVVVADSYSLIEGSAATVMDLTANDTDVEGDTLSVVSIKGSYDGFVTNFGGVVKYQLANPTWTGVDVFTYYVSDGEKDGSDNLILTEGQVTVTVEAKNNIPIAVDDTLTLLEDSDSIQVDVLLLDSDADSTGYGGSGTDTLAIESFTNAEHGTVRMFGEYLFYTPDENYVGSDSFDYTITDLSGAEATASVDLTVVEVNDAPVTVVDIVNVAEGSDGASLNVIANDHDLEDDVFTLTSVGESSHGTVVQGDAGLVTYIPGFVAKTSTISTVSADHTDGTYEAVALTGGTGAGALATVVISTNGVSSVTVTNYGSGYVAGDTLTISKSIIGGDNNETFDVENYTGADEFSYLTTDVNGEESTGKVTVTVSILNKDPIPLDDVVSVNEDSSFNRILVLNNDNDPDDNSLSIETVSEASYGTTSLGDGVILYKPDANYSGLDSFTYWVIDGEGGRVQATVNVTVVGANDAPVAVDDNLGSISSTRPTQLDVMGNDYDVDADDRVELLSVSTPTYGKAVVTGEKIKYVANKGEAGKSESFTYTIKDLDGIESTGQVNFTLSTNTNPIAVNDKITIDEDAGRDKILVLENDTDQDGDTPKVLSISSDPSHGVAEIENGYLYYKPTANYNGVDQLDYIIKDGNGGRSEATLYLTITEGNDAPNAVVDQQTIEINSSATEINVLANDTDIDGDSLSISSVVNPLHGTVSINGSASAVIYTPTAGYDGSDSFTYNVTDGTTTSTGKVNIDVIVGNTIPTIGVDTATFDEDSLKARNAIDVLANDSDTEQANTELSIVSVTNGAYGKVSILNEKVYYVPDSNFFGDDIFTYTVSDGNGGSNSGKVSVTITAIDDSPIATDDVLASVRAGSPKIEVDLLSNDSDPDGDTFSITSVGDARYGTVTLAGSSVYYQPGSEVVSDIFTYTITDANGTEATGNVSVDVIAANNSPTGDLEIIGGAQPYQTLTVRNTLVDEDSAVISFNYQWYKDGTEIDGETSTAYRVSLEDVGSVFTVQASYTDGIGVEESVTSAATDAVTEIDQPFSFVAGDIDENGILTLTLKADVGAIYSRDDITSLTGADLSLDIDWDKFAVSDEFGGEKYSIETLAGEMVVLESSSESKSGTFDSMLVTSLRMNDEPYLTLVDTDSSTIEIGSSDNLIIVSVKPLDITEKISISLSGTIEANQGQVDFTQYDSTLSNITGDATNSAPVGTVTISGVANAVGQTLIAGHTLSDADGMNAVAYQWYRDDEIITGEIESEYTIVKADLNKTLLVKAAYEDNGKTVEVVASNGIKVTQLDDNKPFMFVPELITAAEASIERYGQDYSLDPTETILKLTLNGDITRFDTSNSSTYTSVAGTNLDIVLDWTQFETIKYDDSTSETFEIKTEYAGQIFAGTATNESNEFTQVLLSSLNITTKPLLTLFDSVTTTGKGSTDLPSAADMLTLYLNPLDTVKSIELTYGGQVSVNQGEDTYTQLDHTLEVDVKTYDAIISTSSTSSTITKLKDVSINLWEDGSDTGSSVAVDTGEISIDSTVTFDEVKLSANAYDFDIKIADAIDVLRHIVRLEEFTSGSAGFHAADVNNDGSIEIGDAIDVLRHIVKLETIDTFDIIDSDGNRVTQLDANSSGEAPTWTIVANGDVDMSGGFVDDYVVTSDLV